MHRFVTGQFASTEHSGIGVGIFTCMLGVGVGVGMGAAQEESHVMITVCVVSTPHCMPKKGPVVVQYEVVVSGVLLEIHDPSPTLHVLAPVVVTWVSWQLF